MLSQIGHHHHRLFRIERDKVIINKHEMKHWIDGLVLIVAVGGTCMMIPQILKIWQGQTAAGLALPTWIAYVVGTSFWLLYGIVHKDKVLIIVNILATIFNACIVIGILKFS